MKHFSLIVAFILSNQLYAQITVDDGDFISGADTVLVSVVSDYQNINYQTTGANSVWDFTAMVVDSQRVDTFYAANTASLLYQITFNNPFSSAYQSSYFLKVGAGLLPTGPLPIPIENPVLFEKVSSSKLERVGLGIELSGIGIPVTADPIDIVYEFPMTYQDNWAHISELYIDLNPGFDAIFKRQQNRSTVVDGHGTITTDFGTFDCIRTKSDILYTDSIFFDLLGTGGAWFPLPSPAETQYRWIAKNQKIPVLSIDVVNDIGGPAITKVEFRDSKGIANIANNSSDLNISLFPNPAKSQLNIAGLNGTEGISITNISGQVIYTSNASNQKTLAINCDEWAKGLYIVKITDDKKTQSKKIILQ